MRMRVCVLGVALSLAAVACGSKTTEPTPTPGPSNTITITAAGVSPKSIQVTPGSRVRFVNNDTRSHNMTSDPHPEHNDCVDVNQVGFLSAGQSRETGNLVVARTCGFHDHDMPEVTGLQGSIIIR